MLLTEVSPVINFGGTLATITTLYLAAIWSGVKIASNGYGRLLAIELTQMACFWTQTKSTWRAIFNRKKASFVVTSKRGRQSNSIVRHVIPQILYIMGSTTAITWAAANCGCTCPTIWLDRSSARRCCCFTRTWPGL